MHSTIRYLYSLQRFGMKFGLRNIRTLLRSIGNPHRKFKSIHVAGTNGKGSTSSMIAAIYAAAGYRVGLYTSPHLVRFNERIRINGTPISDRDIARIARSLRPHIDKVKGTFFEAATAIAFRYFAEQRVDIAVIETGLGGRLDATNVLRPLVSVITAIGKDHTEQLGTTITSIAREKAGIIKPTTPVVIGKLGTTAHREIGRRAAALRSPLLRSRYITIPGDISVQLCGQYQTENARCAVAAVTLTLDHFVLGDSSLKNGLEKTTALTGLRGRFETVRKSPTVILDVAHNPDGIRSLVQELHGMQIKKCVVVFGVMKDKDSHAMLKLLQRLKPLVICTQPETERALSSIEIGAICNALKIRYLIVENVKEAVNRSLKAAGKKGTVVITGSHYVVGEALPHIKIQKMP